MMGTISDESMSVVEISRVLNRWKRILHIDKAIFPQIAYVDVDPTRGSYSRVEIKPGWRGLLLKVDPEVRIEDLDFLIGRQLIYWILRQYSKETWLPRLDMELRYKDWGGWLLMRFDVLQKMDKEGTNIEVVDDVNFIFNGLNRAMDDILYELALKIYNFYKDEEKKEAEKKEEKPKS